MSNGTLTDVELIAKKQSEITHGKLIQAVLVIIIALLVGTVAMLILFARITPPANSPNLDVINRFVSTCEDGSKAEVCVPTTITAGEPFTYYTAGEKLVDNFAKVELQIICKVEDSEFTSSIATVPYSDIQKGKFEIKRSTSVPIVSRIQSSDDCKLQSITSYTFYSENNGNVIPFIVTEVATSNKFQLVVPEEEVSVAPPVIVQTPAQPTTTPATPQVENQPEPVPSPEQVQPDPQPTPNTCIASNLPLLGGLLCRVI